MSLQIIHETNDFEVFVGLIACISKLMQQDIIKKSLELYDQVRPKNSDSSYTVLATLSDSVTGELIALATGTQASIKRYPKDIEDCHAESLVKRAYKRYLIGKIKRITRYNETETDLRTTIKLECEQKLTLFISQFPCGLIKRYQGIAVEAKRKPGRGLVKDGTTHYVNKDSCLNKLKGWLVSGLQGKHLFETFDFRCLIDQIIIAGCEPDESVDYTYYASTLKQHLSCDVVIHVARDIRNEDFIFQQDKRQQPTSVVWWKPDESCCDRPAQKKRKCEFSSNLEYIVDGRKKGITKKQSTSGDTKFQLQTSSSSLRLDISELMCHG